ncbi:hypothetical protein O987_14090 [Comamonas testosteroni TK102]|uniref:DUF4440 domain-containing protein n=1 Tax=Comamonas testosteroni TK102 TaxID=1392005 RepID=A0A076PJI4_COMTE|nr:nuclear transport factor 2 family protein [Comamonas testosteroni]AIJ46934.1 hypothetical protein O987_14090 [Comamonas testosteroni TK102]
MSMISRTHGCLCLPALALGALIALPALAAGDEDAVAAKLEEFRSAQMAANAGTLTELTAPELSYSHSDARVEDRATFVANTTSGKKPFLSLEYREPTIRVVGSNAIVRFHWMGEQQAVADGKKTATNLHILMVWQKQGGDWRLLARSATKP